MKHAACFVSAVALTFLLAGCGSQSDEPQAEPSAIASYPETATADTTGPLPHSRYDDGPRAADGPIDAALASQGEKIFTTRGCTTCHGWGKRISGPDLQGVVKDRTARWMEMQIMHPDTMTHSDSISHALLAEYKIQMTNLHLQPSEAKSVVEYFKRRERTGK